MFKRERKALMMQSSSQCPSIRVVRDALVTEMGGVPQDATMVLS
jgi:hypothetical protein